MPAVQSKPIEAGLVPWLTSHPASRPALISFLLLLIFARKKLFARLSKSAVKGARGGSLTEAQMDHYLEQVYVPSRNPRQDPSYELLVPHRGRISKVKVHPTKQSTFDAHFNDFKRLPPVASSTIVSQKAKDKKEVTDEDRETAKKQERQAIKAEGGAAAASAKKVGVNKEFFRQLKALFRIMIPRSNAKEVFILT